MEWIITNGQIAFVLLLWILATFGYGGAMFYLYEKTCAPAVSLQDGLKFFTQLILQDFPHCCFTCFLYNRTP